MTFIVTKKRRRAMLKKITYLFAATACLITILSGVAYAQEDEQTVYGWQLMTEQERTEFRGQMRNMKTEEERQAFRYDHHERMEERAKKMGVKLSDEPGEYRKGMRKGPKDGYGMGPKDGSGMGPKDGSVYGWQLMTEQERTEFRGQMRNMKTEEERQAFRYDHHERMEERAKKMGVKLSDEPGEYKKGMRRGPQDGSGMGPGYGSGKGPRDGSGRGVGNSGQR